ncbi:hypothetical protein [Burkholderia ambifaria]|nr:hypothetical protein [Burkholderia ambifaria]
MTLNDLAGGGASPIPFGEFFARRARAPRGPPAARHLTPRAPGY